MHQAGDTVEKGDECGTVESTKAASEIYAPVSGEILEANEGLADTPADVNESPESDAWFYKIRMSDETELEDLLDEDAYRKITTA